MGNTKTTRRAFFTGTSALLGAGVATAAAAASRPAAPEGEAARLQAQLAKAAARDAVRELHRRFLALIQAQRLEEAAALFDERRTFDLSGPGDELQTAWRHDALRGPEAIDVAADGTRATGRFPVEVELSAPLVGDSSLIAMARLQGHVAGRRWEAGHFETSFAQVAGTWRITSLNYISA